MVVYLIQSVDQGSSRHSLVEVVSYPSQRSPLHVAISVPNADVQMRCYCETRRKKCYFAAFGKLITERQNDVSALNVHFDERFALN